jgi:hypothetical protein
LLVTRVCGVAREPHDGLGALSRSKRLAPTKFHGMAMRKFLGGLPGDVHDNQRKRRVKDNPRYLASRDLCRPHSAIHLGATATPLLFTFKRKIRAG